MLTSIFLSSAIWCQALFNIQFGNVCYGEAVWGRPGSSLYGGMLNLVSGGETLDVHSRQGRAHSDRQRLRSPCSHSFLTSQALAPQPAFYAHSSHYKPYLGAIDPTTIRTIKGMAGNPGRILILGGTLFKSGHFLNDVRKFNERTFGLTMLNTKRAGYVVADPTLWPFRSRSFSLIYNVDLFYEIAQLGFQTFLERGAFVYEIAGRVYQSLIDTGYFITDLPYHFDKSLEDVGFVKLPFHLNGRTVWIKKNSHYHRKTRNSIIKTST